MKTQPSIKTIELSDPSINAKNGTFSYRTTLLAVIGLSPQVLTETLYALHQNNQAVHAIHVISTRDGKDKIFSELLTGGNGYYFQYLKDYPPENDIDFGPENIHTIHNENGIELPDIISASDNEHLLKTCIQWTAHLTQQPDNRVLFSVAGGRKTMSSCLTLAAQLYGRPQDRIYHVIISPEFESNREFYYPPKKSRQIQLYDKKGNPYYKESQYANIDLINIPFVSVRNQLPQDMLEGTENPLSLMNTVIKDTTPVLHINLNHKRISYNDIQMPMKPAHLALYAFFAMEKQACKLQKENCEQCQECFMDIGTIYDKQDVISKLYSRITNKSSSTNLSSTGITNLSAENFNMYKGKIKKMFQSAFGPYALKSLEIASVGTRPNKRYGLKINKKNIQVT